MSRVIIVGAGISGLAVAYRLGQRLPSVQVTVLEQNHRPGGKIWTERRDGFQVEVGPNGFLDTKPSTTSLCRDLGIGQQLLPASETSGKNRYLFLGGKLRPLPGGPLRLLGTSLLSWRGKLDLFLERFRRRRKNGADESIDAFVRRRAGAEAAEVLADALVTGIHAGDPRLLSIKATFPRLVALEKEFGSIIEGLARMARQRRREAAARGETYRRPGQMWSFREGLRLLIETLRDHLAEPPLLGVTARALRSERAGLSWTVQGEGQDRWSAEAVILACPAYAQAALLAELDAELANRIAEIPYNRVAVVALGFREEDVPFPLDGFGYIAPQKTRRDVLGVQWCSSIFPERAPSAMVLLRAMCGGWHRPELVDWEETRLVEAVRHDLRQTMGIEAAPAFHLLVRWDQAIPQYHLGHLERVAWIDDRVKRYPGLFLGGNAYHGVAMNDCTEAADKMAEQVREYLGQIL